MRYNQPEKKQHIPKGFLLVELLIALGLLTVAMLSIVSYQAHNVLLQASVVKRLAATSCAVDLLERCVAFGVVTSPAERDGVKLAVRTQRVTPFLSYSSGHDVYHAPSAEKVTVVASWVDPLHRNQSLTLWRIIPNHAGQGVV